MMDQERLEALRKKYDVNLPSKPTAEAVLKLAKLAVKQRAGQKLKLATELAGDPQAGLSDSLLT